MKAEARHALQSFLIELAVYAVLVIAYFFLVLHLLGGWLKHLSDTELKIYAVVSIGLIIGQAVLLESITTGLLRWIRGRRE